MKRLLKYLVIIFIILVCVYGFWLWLQYKGATVIKKTTDAIITEIQKVDEFSTIKKTYTKIIEGEQELAKLTPDIGIEEILASALFQDKMILEVQGIVDAGYMVGDITEKDIVVTRDGTVIIILGEAQILGITLIGKTQTNILGITTQKDIDIEKKLREQAGEMIIQEAIEEGILKEAKNKAKSELLTIFLNAEIQIKEIRIQERTIEE